MVISLNSKRIIPVLLGTALLLTLINIVVLYFGFHSERRMVEMLANIYDFDYEGTVPAFFPQLSFSSMLSSLRLITGNLDSIVTVIPFTGAAYP
jgi:hypothetical protein